MEPSPIVLFGREPNIRVSFIKERYRGVQFRSIAVAYRLGELRRYLRFGGAKVVYLFGNVMAVCYFWTR